MAGIAEQEMLSVDAPVEHPVLSAPLLQSMTKDLQSIHGVVLKQHTQAVSAAMQATGGCFQQQSRWRVLALPSDKHAAREQKQPGAYQPTAEEMDALQELLDVQEESSCLLRSILSYLGGLNLRKLKLHVYDHGEERLTVHRPCKLGGCLCCPLEMVVRQDGVLIGKVEEAFAGEYCMQCWRQCCLCTFTHKVLVADPSARERLAHKHSLQVSLCCCGRVNNCCGASCCKPNLILDVLSPDGRILEATAQKTYGRGKGCSALARCVFFFDNWVMEFPEHATAAERALLLTSLLNVEYAHFARTGGDL